MSRLWFPVTVLLVLSLVSCASRPPAYQEQGWASYVADYYTGRMTSSGQIYYPQAYTAAHTSLPFGSVLTVENIMNGREVEVTVNDRFPYYPGRVINLSSAAAQHIGIPYMQMGQVKVTAKTLAQPAYGQQPQQSRASSYGGGYQQQPAYSQPPAYQPQPSYQSQPQAPYGGYQPQQAAPTYPGYQPPAGGGYQVQQPAGGAPNAPAYRGGGTPPGLRTF